jgi:hypothetical protein
MAADNPMTGEQRELTNLRALLEAHLNDDAGPHSITVCAETGLRAVAIAEKALLSIREEDA